MTVGPIARSDSFVGQAASIASPSSAKAVDVPANGFVNVPMQGELPEFTTYQSWIRLSVGEESALYKLLIERRPLQLSFLGAVNNRLELSTSSRSIKVPITFKLADGQPDLTQLHLAVSSIARDDGRALEGETLQVSETGPLTLKVGQYQTVHLVGSKMSPGKYWARLEIRDLQSTQVMDLLLNCAEPTQRISLVPANDTSAYLWFWSARTQTRLIVDEIGGRSAEVYQPHVESIERLNTPASAVSLADVGVTVVQDDGANSSQALTSAQSSPVTTIAPRDSAEWTVQLGNLNAGRYKARVAVSGPDLAKVVDEFQFTVRHMPLYALIPLGLGVFFSFRLQRYLRTDRANRLRDVDITRLEDQIQLDAAKRRESPVWPALLLALKRLREELKLKKRSLSDPEFDAQLKDIDTRRSLNLSAVAKMRQLQGHLALVPGAYERDRQSFIEQGAARLSELEKLLETDLSSKSNKPTEIETALQAFDKLNDTARRFRFVTPIAALVKECKAFKTWVSKDPGRSSSFLNRLESVAAELTALEEVARVGDLTGIEQRLSAAAGEYLRLRVDDLDSQLRKLNMVRNTGALPGQWADFDKVFGLAQAALEESKNADAATGEQSKLLRKAALNAQLAQVEYLQVAVRNSCPTDVDRATWSQWLDDHQVQKHLDLARDAAMQGDPEVILLEFQRAQSAYQSVLGQSINARVDTLIKLVETAPTRIGEQPWREALDKDPLKSAIPEFQKMRDLKDAPSVQSLQRKFTYHRLKLLRCTVEVAQALVTADKDATSELRLILERLAKAQQSLTQLTESEELLPQAALREASQAAEQAQASYAQFVQLRKGMQITTREFNNPQVTSVHTNMLGTPQMSAVPGLLQTATMAPPTPPPAPDKVDSLIRSVERDDTKIELASIVIATLFGFIAMYWSNDIWGSCFDYISAALWGFGLNEASAGILGSLAGKGIGPKV